MDNIKKLQEYDDLYYNDGTSPVSDLEYDRLKEKAKKENPDHPYFQRVGSKNFKTGKVDLPFILGSLTKTTLETIDEFLQGINGPKIVMEKLDGVSFYVEYLDGQVKFSSTRGDGYTGRDITEKAKIFCSNINPRGKIKLRGEAMLIGEIHEEIGFKTARNGVAGIINRDDGKYCEHIVPFFYEAIEGIEGNEIEKLEFIRYNIGRTPRYMLLEDNDVGMLLSFLEVSRKYSVYETDGLVISPLNYEREDVLYPENKVAFKVNREPIETTVTKVDWKVTRTGRITPIVHVKPVKIQGVTVSKATGFNYDFIITNNIGKGAVVKIVRSGDVIPYITAVEKIADEGPAHPIECPSCGKTLFTQGVDLRCNNPLCDESSYYKTEYFLRTLGAENISYKTLMKLGLNSPKSCYEVDEWEISSIDGFGMKKAQIVFDEIQSTLSTTPEKLLAAFGIPNVSLITAQAIISKMETLENVFNATANEFERIEGIGEKTAKNLVENLPNYIELYQFLQENGLTFESRGSILRNKVFCLTGKGPMSRPNLIKAIEGEGGYVKGMSKSVDYLVCADKNTKSSKAKKARKYGTKIITYDELMEILNV